jgi:hypothetical protein
MNTDKFRKLMQNLGMIFGVLELAGFTLCFRFRQMRVTDHGNAYSRLSESARLGTTKDSRKIGKMLFPLHR